MSDSTDTDPAVDTDTDPEVDATTDPGLDDDTDSAVDLSEHVVATSEDEPPVGTIGRILGVGADTGDVVDRFVEHEIAIAVEDFFLDEETRHEVRWGGRVEHVPCVADALQAAILIDHEPVTVRSIDPTSGEPVTVEVADDDATVDPPEAVASIGAAEAAVAADVNLVELVAESGGEPDFECGAGGVRDVACRHINAFESRANYREWVERSDAVSVAVPIEALLPGMREFVATPAFE